MNYTEVTIKERSPYFEEEAKEVYKDVPVSFPDLEGHKEQIVRLLSSSPGVPFTAKLIAKNVGLSTKGTQVEVRKAITELIVNEKLPIVSVDKGFLWAVSSNQLLRYSERLKERQMGLQRRISAVDEARRKLEKEECV